MPESDNAKPNTPPTPASEHDVARGLVTIHDLLIGNAESIHDVAAHVFALSELLIKAGVISLHELESRKAARKEELLARLRDNWAGARMDGDPRDKYQTGDAVLLDCAERIPLCRAACCRLAFPLSVQDLAEGIVRWDFARPYTIAHREDGYCVHCDGSLHCQIHGQRPRTCRVYDCRSDRRIWLDFEGRQVNPEILGGG